MLSSVDDEVSNALGRCRAAAAGCSTSRLERELAGVHEAWASASHATEESRRASANLSQAMESLSKVTRHFAAADEAHMTLNSAPPVERERRSSYEEAARRCVAARSFLSRNGRHFSSSADEIGRVDKLLTKARGHVSSQLKEIVVKIALEDEKAERKSANGGDAERWLCHVARLLDNGDPEGAASRQCAQRYGEARRDVAVKTFARLRKTDAAGAMASTPHDRPYEDGSHPVLRHYEFATRSVRGELLLARSMSDDAKQRKLFERAALDGAAKDVFGRLRRAVRTALEHVAMAPGEQKIQNGGIVANCEAARAALDLLHRHSVEFAPSWRDFADVINFGSLADDLKEGAVDAVRATVEAVGHQLSNNVMDVNKFLRSALSAGLDVCVASARLRDSNKLHLLPSLRLAPSTNALLRACLRDVSKEANHAELCEEDDDDSDQDRRQQQQQPPKDQQQPQRRRSSRLLGSTPGLNTFSKGIRKLQEDLAGQHSLGSPPAPDCDDGGKVSDEMPAKGVARALVAELLRAVATMARSLRVVTQDERDERRGRRDHAEELVFAGSACDALATCRAEYFLAGVSVRLTADLVAHRVDELLGRDDGLLDWLGRLKTASTLAFTSAWSGAVDSASPLLTRDAKKVIDAGGSQNVNFSRTDAALIIKKRFATFNAFVDRLAVPMRTWHAADRELCLHIRKTLSANLVQSWTDFYQRYATYSFVSKHQDRYLRYTPAALREAIKFLFSDAPADTTVQG